MKRQQGQNIYLISGEDDIGYYLSVPEKMRQICVDFLMRYL